MDNSNNVLADQEFINMLLSLRDINRKFTVMVANYEHKYDAKCDLELKEFKESISEAASTVSYFIGKCAEFDVYRHQ